MTLSPSVRLEDSPTAAAPTLYGSLASLTQQFGEAELLMLAQGPDDDEGQPTLDGQRVLDALARASREADTYIAPRYAVPLPVSGDDTPEPLKSVVGDMTRYHLTGGNAQESESIIRRYEEAREWLKSVAKGVTDLLLPGADGGDPAEDDDNAVQILPGIRVWGL